MTKMGNDMLQRFSTRCKLGTFWLKGEEIKRVSIQFYFFIIIESVLVICTVHVLAKV